MTVTDLSPREKRRHKRRLEILGAALDVFAERGFHNASMEEIAERALLTRVSLYNHFGDKLALLQALLTSKSEELVTRIDEAVRDVEATDARLAAMVRETLAFQEANRGVLHIFLTASGLPELIGQRPLEIYIRRVADILREGVQRGDLVPTPPLATAELFTTMVFVDTLTAYAPREDAQEGAEEVDEAALLVQVFLRGVLKPA